MKIIYKPNGKAREYSPYAANLYTGCNHGCTYCYGPGIMRQDRQQFITPVPRKNAVQHFEKGARKHANTGTQVFLSFITDPYNSEEEKYAITRECLKIALNYKIPIVILTKSTLVLRDMDLLKQFGKNIQVGMSLTCANVKKSQYIEPSASLPADRLYILQALHDNNVPTWASLEPVLFPHDTLFLIKKTLDSVDLYKIGILNHCKQFDTGIDWHEFANLALYLLRTHKKNIYIKESLRKQIPDIELCPGEDDMDRHVLKWCS